MSREEIIAKLAEYAAMAFEVDAAGVNENTDLAKDLGTSSTKIVAMAASIENDFDVMIPVARFTSYKTIGGLADYIMEEM